MLTVTKKNPFYKAICWFLTKPVSPNFKAHCIRKLEFASGAGSLACSTMASILHIATVIFAIVMVAPGPAFTAVVLTGTALAGMSILLAITFIALKQGCFGTLKQRPQMPLQNTQSSSGTALSDFPFSSPQLPHSNIILHNQISPCLQDQEKEELKKEVKELKEKLKEQTKRADDWSAQTQKFIGFNSELREQMKKKKDLNKERKERIRELGIEKAQLETRLKEVEKENPIKDPKDRSIDRSWTEMPPDDGSSHPNS